MSASDSLGGRVARTVPVIDPEVTVQQVTGAADPAVGRSDHAPGDTLHDRDHSTDFAATVPRSVTATTLTLAGL